MSKKMGTTRWRKILTEFAGTMHREFRVSVARTPSPDKWVFVVGCYNSGTTLLAEILGSHPSISALPTEGQYLTDQFPRDHEIGLSRMWTARDDLYRLTEADYGPDVTRLKKEWGIRLDRSKPIFLEKTPANCARMRWLQANFPNAHFVAIVRNGYAVVEGILRKAKPIHSRNGWPVELAARQWARSNTVIFDDAPKLTRFHWLTYEALTDNTEQELNKILQFLGLDTGIDLARSWSVHERNEPISNLNANSIARISAEDITTINTEAGPALERFGYKIG